jgi:hypothetical protein
MLHFFVTRYRIRHQWQQCIPEYRFLFKWYTFPASGEGNYVWFKNQDTAKDYIAERVKAKSRLRVEVFVPSE